jgi:hypothetical protein
MLSGRRYQGPRYTVGGQRVDRASTPSPPRPPLRDQVIAPILAAVRSPKMGRKPAHWTRVDRDYERIRIDMQTLFNDLAIETPLAA